MNQTHQKLKQNALDAVDALNSDTSVTKQETLESLDEVGSKIDSASEAISEEISAGEADGG